MTSPAIYIISDGIEETEFLEHVSELVGLDVGKVGVLEIVVVEGGESICASCEEPLYNNTLLQK